MKVISIMQPWATLVAVGEKQYETRSWRTKYRRELAIHASKKADKSVCRYEPFLSVLAKHGYTAKNLPTGALLAVGRIVNCLQVIDNMGDSAILDGGAIVSGNEYIFGGYGEGRFAWEMADVALLREPLPAKGKLGLWEHTWSDSE